MRTAVKGALATLDRETGHPYVSLVLAATEPDGSPVFLLSMLARHAKNLQQDARASLLIDGTAGVEDTLTGDRVTLLGEVRVTDSRTARRRFLARHDSARDYADFGDFAVYRMKIGEAHCIGGFGRIVTLQPVEILTDLTGADPLIEAEPDIIGHMNADHADAVSLYATELAGAPAGDWRMSGIDPEGADLLHRTNAARLVFDKPIRTPGEARAALVAQAQAAREHRGGRPLTP